MVTDMMGGMMPPGMMPPGMMPPGQHPMVRTYTIDFAYMYHSSITKKEELYKH